MRTSQCWSFKPKPHYVKDTITSCYYSSISVCYVKCETAFKHFKFRKRAISVSEQDVINQMLLRERTFSQPKICTSECPDCQKERL